MFGVQSFVPEASHFFGGIVNNLMGCIGKIVKNTVRTAKTEQLVKHTAKFRR